MAAARGGIYSLPAGLINLIRSLLNGRNEPERSRGPGGIKTDRQ